MYAESPNDGTYVGSCVVAGAAAGEVYGTGTVRGQIHA